MKVQGIPGWLGLGACLGGWKGYLYFCIARGLPKVSTALFSEPLVNFIPFLAIDVESLGSPMGTQKQGSK